MNAAVRPRNMPTSSSVSFVVGSTIQDLGTPDEVTASMGTEPTEVYWSDLQSRDKESKEMVTHATWLWMLRSPLDDSYPPFQRLSALLQLLLPYRVRIGTIPPKYWKHIQCNYDSTPNDFLILNDWGLNVSPEDVSLLSSLGLGLSCNTRVWQTEAYRINIEKAEQGAPSNDG
jgi:hypothetical protein